MSRQSRQRDIRPPYRETGRCSWCGTRDLPPRRKTWCSQACVEAYQIRKGGADLRRIVYERDGGICAICGCDADRELRAWKQRNKEIARLADKLAWQSRWNLRHDGRRWGFVDTSTPDGREIRRYTKKLLRRWNPGNWTAGRTSGWDADHIVPVCEDGADLGIANIRTLCIPCHKAETKKLAARRAKRRKQSYE